MKTLHRTYVQGTCLYMGESLDEAIRVWDAHTFNVGRSVAGGVTVQTYSGDVMVRDGWVLHVHEDGVVYLNPNLLLK